MRARERERDRDLAGGYASSEPNDLIRTDHPDRLKAVIVDDKEGNILFCSALPSNSSRGLPTNKLNSNNNHNNNNGNRRKYLPHSKPGRK